MYSTITQRKEHLPAGFFWTFFRDQDQLELADYWVFGKFAWIDLVFVELIRKSLSFFRVSSVFPPEICFFIKNRNLLEFFSNVQKKPGLVYLTWWYIEASMKRWKQIWHWIFFGVKRQSWKAPQYKMCMVDYTILDYYALVLALIEWIWGRIFSAFTAI